MKRTRNLLSLAVVIVLVLSMILSGCGQKQAEQPSSGETTAKVEQPSTTEAKQLEPVELKWYYPAGEFPDQAAVFEKANEIVKSKINATVNFMPTSWGEYEDKIRVLMASGDKFDLSFAASWINNFIANQSKGAYLPLDDLLQQYAPKLYSSIEQRFWDGVRFNGKIYGVINQQIFARTSAFGVNKELADKYGFNPDTIGNKLENLEPFFDQILKNEKMIPTMMIWEYLYEYYGIETLTGGITPGAVRLSDTGAKVINQYDSDEYRSFIALTYDWGKKGFFGGDTLISVKDLGTLLVEKKMASYTGGTFKPGGESESSAKWGYPVYERALSDAYVTNFGLTATIQTINRNAANPERAMMFLELMNSSEDTTLYNLICNGIEGQHYTKTGDKRIEPVKETKYFTGTSWEFGNTFNAFIVPGQPDDVWEQTKKMNQEAKTSPLIGFTFNPESVKSEITQCNSVVEEFKNGFNYGLLDIDKEYKAFLEKLNKAGAQKIIDEMQKQVDAFKK